MSIQNVRRVMQTCDPKDLAENKKLEAELTVKWVSLHYVLCPKQWNNECLSLTFNYVHQIWKMWLVLYATMLSWSINPHGLYPSGKKTKVNFFFCICSHSCLLTQYLFLKQINIMCVLDKVFENGGIWVGDLSTQDNMLPLLTALTFWFTSKVSERFNVKIRPYDFTN